MFSAQEFMGARWKHKVFGKVRMYNGSVIVMYMYESLQNMPKILPHLHNDDEHVEPFQKMFFADSSSRRTTGFIEQSRNTFYL